MQHDAASTGALASPRRWCAQAAFKVAAVLIGLTHKMPATLAALGHGQHVVVNKLHQAPGFNSGTEDGWFM